MKNIMIIDGALNCAYDIFQATDEEFKLLFPDPGQDIAFIEEVEGQGIPLGFLNKVWERPVPKTSVNGIHGTLFFDFAEKREFYPNRKDTDLDFKGRSFSVNELLKRHMI